MGESEDMMFAQICSVREGPKDIHEFMLGGKY